MYDMHLLVVLYIGKIVDDATMASCEWGQKHVTYRKDQWKENVKIVSGCYCIWNLRNIQNGGEMKPWKWQNKIGNMYNVAKVAVFKFCWFIGSIIINSFSNDSFEFLLNVLWDSLVTWTYIYTISTVSLH